MYHKSSPLFHMKVPKTEPILQFLKSNFISYPRGIPPTLDCCISNICLFQRNGIFIFITQCLMFFSQLQLDLLFCVSIHGLTLMEKISSFFVNHWLTYIFIAIDNSNIIPIGLNIVGHKSFEVCIGNTIIGHHFV